MSIESAVGYSQAEDAFSAGVEAAEMALEKTNGRADAVFVFSSVKYDQEKMLAGVHSVVKDVPLVGCSTDGEIGTDGYMEDSVSLMVLNSDELSFSMGYGLEANKDARKTGQDTAQMALDSEIRKNSRRFSFYLGMELKQMGLNWSTGPK